MDSIGSSQDSRCRELVEKGFDRPSEAAAFLGISRSHLYALMERGELMYAKFGKSRRIPRVALVEYAARRLIVSQAGRDGVPEL